MCYSTSSRLKKDIEYAKQRFDDEQQILKLEQLILEFKDEARYYFANGFGRPKLMVFTDAEPSKPQLFKWGLIAPWIKTEVDLKKSLSGVLNARGETIWEKPSFKSAANNRRCLIYVDSFFENHHQGKLKYPFRIKMKDDSPIILAGLWGEWVNQGTGEIESNFTIVTTNGNPLLAKIHNNPEAEMGSRMPVILSKEKQEEWLIPCNTEADKKHLMELIKPFDEDLLTAYTVPRLLGKEGVGNSSKAIEKFEYSELELKV
jgi:putative SOS response-associated peptidase YedK